MLTYKGQTRIHTKEKQRIQIMDMKFLTGNEGEIGRARIKYDTFRQYQLQFIILTKLEKRNNYNDWDMQKEWIKQGQ
jgi:hypothetical protein